MNIIVLMSAGNSSKTIDFITSRILDDKIGRQFIRTTVNTTFWCFTSTTVHCITKCTEFFP